MCASIDSYTLLSLIGFGHLSDLIGRDSYILANGAGVMSATSKHEVLAGAAVKRFRELLDQAPVCQCGNNCETRRFLVKQFKARDSRANHLFAELFDEVLS